MHFCAQLAESVVEPSELPFRRCVACWSGGYLEHVQRQFRIRRRLGSENTLFKVLIDVSRIKKALTAIVEGLEVVFYCAGKGLNFVERERHSALAVMLRDEDSTGVADENRSLSKGSSTRRDPTIDRAGPDRMPHSCWRRHNLERTCDRRSPQATR